ncbi:hypothetical protein [Scytonema millei]|uniref:Uncharacterized protein n=1 Tax=Scytonema millei VB511283 TaxID=1245923 RepID=A0A9X5E3C0_9CYAN|nr:hypothetical protein [Scytonema millei]NHC33469.1 hypothetical protein [Scytonema millei VB511283]
MVDATVISNPLIELVIGCQLSVISDWRSATNYLMTNYRSPITFSLAN